MANGKRQRGRRAWSRSNGTKNRSNKSRTLLSGTPLSRTLRLEQLEDRRLLAVFPVVNADDLRDDGGDGREVVPGSLRDAIINANEFDDPDTIVFTGPAFDNPVSIDLQRFEDDFGQLAIDGPVDIVGPGPGKVTINAALDSRIFLVDDGDNDFGATVSISGVSLVGGNPGIGDEDGRGGSILNRDALSISNVEIRNATAQDGGGAIFNEFGRLQITQSLIRDNTSMSGGGGIQNGLADQTDNLPSTTIINSLITGNTAVGIPGADGETGYGGGVLNSAGTMNIEQSTIYGNYAYYFGGGSATQGFDAMKDDMGAPTVFTGYATTNIRSSIITGNTISDRLGGTFPEDVGSVGFTEDDPPLPFEPQINSLGYNLFGILSHPRMTVRDDVTLPPGGMNDVSGVDPKSLFIDDGDLLNPVAVLDDYGGDLPTYMPDSGKAGFAMIVDQGDPDLGFVKGDTDQRGRHFSRVFPDDMGVIDIGATEVQNGIFVVDSLEDESDREFRAGDFTLREAIEFSEKNPERDTIAFSSGLRLEVDPNPFTPAPTIQITVGDIVITKGVDIVGPVFQLEVDGTSSSRIFNINDGEDTAAISVTIRDLTLLNGGGVVDGGAIINSENLTLKDTYFEGNNASLNGGALYVQRGNVTVDSSTFLDNSTANNGGAIYVDATAGTVNLINSTLSANEAANRGAGLTNLGADTNVRYSTITLNNSASTRGSGITNLGGGLITVHSSIVAGNLNNDIEFFGGAAAQITSSGYNLVGIGNAAFTQFVAAGDQNGILDPKLAPLAFTGGPTPTHRVLANSLALDAGDPTAMAGAGGVPAFDQRGMQSVRVFDGNLSGTATIDIGAYELQEVTYRVDSIEDENDGDFSEENFSLREAIEVANVSVSPLPETIIFDIGLFGMSIDLSPDELAPLTTPDINITSPVKLIGPGITINGSGLDDGVNTFPMFTIDDGDDLNDFDVLFDEFSFQFGADRAIASKENLEITSATAIGNNGVFAQTLGTLTIKTSVLTGNLTPNAGGVAVVTDGNLIIEGNPTGYNYTILSGNSTTVTGGNGGTISFSDNTTDGRMLSLSKVIVSGNQAPAGAADGGGLYVSGNGSTDPANMTQVNIVDSVISGNSTTGSNSQGAGAFFKDAEVALTGTIVSLNRSFGTNSRGAGIYVSGGSLTVENSANNNSLITQNSTYGNYAPGAGIANLGGDVTLNGTTVSRNTTSGNDSHGAGIYSSGGSLTLNDTTVSESSSSAAGSKGGAIYTDTNLTGSQSATLFNSTISGNTAIFRGGGVYNADGLLKIQYSTITNNSVPYFANGGGVASFGDSSTTRTEVRSSIIAGNHSTNDLVNPHSDVDAVNGPTNSFVSLGYNVIGQGLPFALNAFNQTGDQTSIVDPGLSPLSFSGGPTAVHEPLPTSPAVNAGDPDAVAGVGNVPANDQRGAGFSRVNNSRIDVGSFESDMSPLAATAATDFNEDGNVNGVDFLILQLGFGTPNATKADGDSNSDMNIDGIDLANWGADFGSSQPPLLAAAADSGEGVPAPVVSDTAAIVADADGAATVASFSNLALQLSLPSMRSSSPIVAQSDGGETVALDASLTELFLVPTSVDFGDIATSRSVLDNSTAEDGFEAEDQVFDLLGSS